MGCCCSKGPTLESLDKLNKWKVQFNALQLRDNELRKMLKVFNKIDVDGSGSISVAELLVHINVNRTPFTERIFSIFDEDGSGEIDFREFVLSLWNYCTLTKATLDMFSFDLYDRDGSGELSAKEVKKMLKDIYGKEYASNFHAQNIKNDLKEIEKKGIPVDIEQFREFSRNHQALLFPAARMQLYLQQKVLGRRFWNMNSQRRIKLSKGKFIPIEKLLEMHVNKELMKSTLGDDVYADLEKAALQKHKSAKDVVNSMRAFSSDDNEDEDAPGSGLISRQLSRSKSRSRDIGDNDHTWFTISHDTNDSNYNNIPVHDVLAAGYGKDAVKLDMKAQVAVEATGMISKRKQALYLNDEAKMTKEAIDTMNLKKNTDPTQRELNASNEQEIALMVAAMQQPTSVLGASSRPSSRQQGREHTLNGSGSNSPQLKHNKSSPEVMESMKRKSDKKKQQDSKALALYGPGEDMSGFIDDAELDALIGGKNGSKKGAHASGKSTKTKPLALNGVSSLYSDLENNLDFPGLEPQNKSNKLSPLPDSSSKTNGTRRKSLGNSPTKSTSSQQQLKSISAEHAASSKSNAKHKDTKIVPLTTEMVEKQRKNLKTPDVGQRLAAGDVTHSYSTHQPHSVPEKTANNAGKATAQALIRARAVEHKKEETDALYVSPQRIAKIGKGEVRIAKRWELEAITDEERKALRSAPSGSSRSGRNNGTSYR